MGHLQHFPLSPPFFFKLAVLLDGLVVPRALSK
jgi:hypothetical protein